MKRHWADLGASVVVFLVALPLCVGVAVASGVPAELGIVTGVVGGIVVGLLPGSTMQVSGPAAGLTVLVADAVGRHGIGALGVIVLGAGLLQVVLGLARCGRWFRAISPAVVQGMLAGIGLVLIFGQLKPILVSPVAMALGLLTVVIVLVWQRTPLRVVPGVLVGVVVCTAVAAVFAAGVDRISVGTLSADVHLADLSLPDTGVIGTAVVFALVASAESMFSAAAVDRMHDGPRTRYDKELVAQGVGNTICGLLGALPMTAVIVRSSANVAAGARTKAARVLHGVWLLVFVVAAPGLLTLIPVAVLAAVLVHAGWKLLGLGQLLPLWRKDRTEVVVLVLTAGLIVATDLLTGTVVGLLAAVVKTAWDVSRLSVVVTADGVALRGNATFLRLPRLLEELERVDREHVRMDLSEVRHLDQACGQAIDQWVDESRRAGRTVELVG
ncbi:SulP family inorganic anion transporter, partial [Lentzea sp. NPDC060358]|uniref:SulP family inorganic anion transporter n=1 Tax=Lentzea sp. NPDC060358 TaxID=3347103 RepID=UPI00365931F1